MSYFPAFYPPTYPVYLAQMNLFQIWNRYDDWFIPPILTLPCYYYRVVRWSGDEAQMTVENILCKSDMFDRSPIVLRQLNACFGSPSYEILDGWQRIKAVGDFVKDLIKIPTLLETAIELSGNVPIEDARFSIIPKMFYGNLPNHVKNYIHSIGVDVIIITGMGNTQDDRHQAAAKYIFDNLRDARYWGGIMTFLDCPEILKIPDQSYLPHHRTDEGLPQKVYFPYQTHETYRH